MTRNGFSWLASSQPRNGAAKMAAFGMQMAAKNVIAFVWGIATNIFGYKKCTVILGRIKIMDMKLFEIILSFTKK
jgi:hypothetical protein